MKKRIFSIILFASIIILLGSGQVKKSTISQKDIEEGKRVVETYFQALKIGNVEEINDTLGKYKNGMYTEDNIKKWTPELISVNYPGKFTNHDIPPSSYKSNYGEDPYKSMNFYVEFKEGTEKQGWDYVLIKETADSPWQIHDWGY